MHPDCKLISDFGIATLLGTLPVVARRYRSLLAGWYRPITASLREVSVYKLDTAVLHVLIGMDAQHHMSEFPVLCDRGRA